MVSKRKSTNDEEPGSSKKRVRSESKSKNDEEVSSSSKSRQKKSKQPKETEPLQKSSTKDYELKKQVNNEVASNAKKNKNLNSDIPNWPIEHMSELLRRIENVLPQRDNLLYKSRADRLNWNEIAFGEYTGIDCRLMWNAIQKRLRRFRILRELVEDAKNWVTKPWTDFYKGNKTNRHPDMPRRPLSTYMIFYLKKKDKVLKENPGLEMTGLSKYIAEMYNKLSPKAKEKYNEMAAEQRRQYEGKLEEFYRLHPEFVPNNTKPASNHSNEQVPKKPPTPFKLFCEDKLKQTKHNSDFEKNAFIEKCKEQWRTMSDKKKVCWINWALDKETKYQEEMKKYVAENPDYIPTQPKSILTKEERTIRERMAGKPEKPPTSAYSLFSRLMLGSQDVKNVSPKERMYVIAQKWKSCSDLEKKEYNIRVKHMLEQYKLQYAEYLESLPEDKRQEELLNNQPKKKKTGKAGKQSPANNDTHKIKSRKTRPTKKSAEKIDPAKSAKKMTLYDGEPEPPPATPFLLFAQSYQASYPDRQDAHTVWQKMSNEQKNIHRRVLQDLKNIYIESYENFLKGLTQEELKDYSEWKKTVKLPNQTSEEVSDESDSESDEDCTSVSDDNSQADKHAVKKDSDDSSSSSE